MKQVVLIIVFFICTSQAAADKVHGGFENGKRYVYEYKTRVGTGVSGESQHFSGLGFIGRVLVQRVDDNIIFQTYDFHHGSFNKKLSNLMDEVEIDYKRLSRPDQEHNLDLLETPFVVEFDTGIFKGISFYPDEDVAKHNNKKSLASLFQLDLNRDGRENLHVYNKIEDSIGGECLTHYFVDHHSDKHHPNEGVLNVTKMRHYDQCKVRPHLFHSTMQGTKCTQCDQENFTLLKSLNQVEYNLRGTRENYVIENIYSIGSIIFTPFSTNGKTILSMVNTTLKLLEVSEAKPIDLPAKMDRETYLYYEFYNDEIDYKTKDLKAAHYYNRIFIRKRDDRMEKAEQLFHELEEELKVEDSSKASRFISQFVDIFTKFDYDDFSQFYEKHVLIDSPKSAQFHLLEIIPFVGTNPSIIYAFHLITSKKVDLHRALKIIQKLPFHVKEPSQKLIEAAKEFGASAIVTGDIRMLTSSRLAYGTLLYKGCKEDDFNPHPVHEKHYIPKEECSKYVQELIESYASSEDDDHRVIFLKAIANTRSEEAYKFAVSILNSNADILLKLSAIAALAHYFPTHKQEIGEILAPIYLNPDEDYVKRLYAFHTLIFLHPTPQFFGNLFLLLTREKNQKINSFIYGVLSALAKSNDPCIQPYKQNAKHILQYMAHYETDIIKDAIVRQKSVYNKKYNYGRSASFITVPSNESLFPREIYLHEGLNLFGYNFDLFELGFSSQGRSFWEESFIPNLFSKLYPSGEAVKHEFVEKAKQKLKFEHAALKEHQAYFRVFNQDVYITRRILDDHIAHLKHTQEIKFEHGSLVLNINECHYIDVELVLPNELGMPVIFNSKIPATFHVHGSLPHMAQDPTGSNINFDLHLGLDIGVHSQVIVDSLLFGDLGFDLKTEAGVHVPFAGNFESNVDSSLKSEKRKITISTPSEPFDLLYYKSVPKILGGNPINIHYSNQRIQKQRNIGHDYFGAGIECNFTYDYTGDDYGSYRQIFKYFFKKSINHENNFYFSDKFYAGTKNFLDYAIFNPNAKPIYFNIRYSRSKSNPTTKFVLESTKTKELKFNEEKNKNFENFDYHAVVTASGPVERKWKFDYEVIKTWLYANDRKVKFHFERNSLPNYDSDPFQICYASRMATSDYTSLFVMIPVKDLAINYESLWRFGKDCNDDAKEIGFKLLVEKSDEQNSHDLTKSSNAEKCTKLTEEGYHYNDYCWKYMMDLGRFDKLTATIEHKNIRPETKALFNRIRSAFRHHFYDNLQIDYLHGSHKENQVQIVANLSYDHLNVADVKIIRPDHTAYYNHINIHSLNPLFEPYSVVEPTKQRVSRILFNYHGQYCIVSDTTVRTFDVVYYKFSSLKKSYYLMFADTYGDKLHVYHQVSDVSPHIKAAKIFMGDVVFDLISNGDQSQATLNDQPIVFDKSGVYVHPKPKFALLYKLGPAGYMLVSKQLKFELYLDSHANILAVSNFYRGKQRGLCGNFDGETRNEFQGPDGHVYDNADEFVNSYAV